MTQEKYADSTLVLVGHGSTKNRESSGTLRRLAAALRAQHCFSEVREAFWKEEPKVQGALAGLQTRQVFVAPFFIAEGYFSEVAIPEALGLRAPGAGGFERIQKRDGGRVIYTRPLGTHPSMTELVIEAARDAVAGAPFPVAPRPGETSLFLVGHGTEKDPNSRKVVDQLVENIRERKLYAAVYSAFIEEQPLVSQCYDMSASRNVVVVPVFTSNGQHVSEDIPILLGEPADRVRQRVEAGQSGWRNPTERKGKRVWCAGSIGTHPQVLRVVMDLVHDAAFEAAAKTE